MTTPVTPVPVTSPQVTPPPGTAPPGAPHEVTQPLDGSARSIPAHLQGMEKELAPLTYPDNARPPVPVVPLEGLAPAEAAAVQGMAASTPVPTPSTLAAAAPGPRTAPMDTTATAAAAVIAAHQHQPAASTTESPSRGAPTPARDPSLQPTGGFGPIPGVNYAPLDGTEVRELVLALFDQIATQMATDLRFVRALTYPRLECRVMVDVITFPPEGAVRITKILPDPKGQLARDIALQHADECCFVVTAQRQELNAAGDSVDPPDKIRDELQLPKPHMQVVGTGAARQLVDVPSVAPGVPIRPIDVNGMPTNVDAARHAVAGAGAAPRVSPGVEVALVPPRPVVGGAG